MYRLMGKAGRRSHGGGLSAASPFRAAGLRPPAAATPLRASTARALAPPARAPPGARSAWRRGSAAAGSAVPARRVAMAAGGEGAPLRLGSQVPSECPPHPRSPHPRPRPRGRKPQRRRIPNHVWYGTIMVWHDLTRAVLLLPLLLLLLLLLLPA